MTHPRTLIAGIALLAFTGCTGGGPGPNPTTTTTTTTTVPATTTTCPPGTTAPDYPPAPGCGDDPVLTTP